MPFEKFKAKHGGAGPFAALYDAMTGGEGIFGQRGLSNERNLTDSLIDSVQGDDALGLAELAEQGRARMTREEHADFRAGLTQAVLTQRTLDAGVDVFSRNMASLRARADNEDELGSLDVMAAQGDYAFKLLRSQDPVLKAQGAKLMGDAMAAQSQFGTALEDRRIQLEESEKAGRETIRKEFQSELDTRLFDPIRQDTANYRAIREQLTGDGAAIASPALTSAVLDYAGASLRQSDDGDWSFSLGPIGLRDKAVPTMTYSQLRNQLDAAQRGRDEYMRGEIANYAELAQRRGLGINGTRVDDLVFPLANATYARREQELAPPPTTSRDIEDKTRNFAENVTNTLEGVGRGAFPNVVKGVTNLLDFVTPDAPEPPPPRRRASGVIDRSAYERLPIND